MHCQDNCIDHLSRYCRSARPRREIIPLDKWEILPEQIEYEEELGRGAFGVVYKAILKKRQEVEVFDTRDELASGKDTQVVAVKELQGAFLFCNHYILVESHIGGLRCLKCYSINCMLLVRLWMAIVEVIAFSDLFSLIYKIDLWCLQKQTVYEVSY